MKIYTPRELLLNATHLSVPAGTAILIAADGPYGSFLVSVAATLCVFKVMHNKVRRACAALADIYLESSGDLSATFNQCAAQVNAIGKKVMPSMHAFIHWERDESPAYVVGVMSHKDKVFFFINEKNTAIFSKDEWDTIFAHEWAHVIAHHNKIMWAYQGGILAAYTNLLCNMWHNYAELDTGSLVAFTGLLLVNRFVYQSLSRLQEYQADRLACEITKKPQSAISAFQKTAWRDYTYPLPSVYKYTLGLFNSLSRTHPITEKRIARIEQAMATDKIKPSSLPPV